MAEKRMTRTEARDRIMKLVKELEEEGFSVGRIYHWGQAYKYEIQINYEYDLDKKEEKQ